MIVRKKEDHLEKYLASVRGLFDEIVIVDTGSIDRTKEIAREFGAKVFDFLIRASYLLEPGQDQLNQSSSLDHDRGLAHCAGFERLFVA
jgi:glycosyltransferase involved in cell wall biosynthesis